MKRIINNCNLRSCWKVSWYLHVKAQKASCKFHHSPYIYDDTSIPWNRSKWWKIHINNRCERNGNTFHIENHFTCKHQRSVNKDEKSHVFVRQHCHRSDWTILLCCRVDSLHILPYVETLENNIKQHLISHAFILLVVLSFSSSLAFSV